MGLPSIALIVKEISQDTQPRYTITYTNIKNGLDFAGTWTKREILEIFYFHWFTIYDIGLLF